MHFACEFIIFLLTKECKFSQFHFCIDYSFRILEITLRVISINICLIFDVIGELSFEACRQRILLI